jgi:uncharacterized membrane protein
MRAVGETATSRSAGANITDRMVRVIARHHRPRSGPGYFLAQMGVLAATCFGAWWTVQAVVAGAPGAVVLRFALSAALGLYYAVLARIVRVPDRAR